MKNTTINIFSTMFIITVMCLAGCSGVYYNTMEKFGHHKRDILVDRVTDARDAQETAKNQFASALEEFTAVLNYDGGELEEKYKRLDAEYKDSKKKADAVHGRIKEVKRVAEALFNEWENELDEYTSDSLRKMSKKKLQDTQKRYVKLITAMEQAETKIDPVLSAFKDQVLFLKHNLNAQAIASLQDELGTLEGEISILIDEMEKSIEQADVFIKQMTLEKS